MGVPKFFRYISERYPCLSEFVKEYQIPVFDNLYLDMNGIIHMCSHPDDNNPHFRITEEKLFSDIFHYIEVLFRMIKPQKLFFMAIDGVAPRAKMNQQRGRRFRSAKDAEKSEKEALKKGEKLPEEARFDSNCITPGTVFMARLHEQLKYFVVKKISTDSQWSKCKVILSGHETPGEGEHKIMDYIRYIRSQPGYDPNTRHCLYGLDADLIMLGLCTHEPHFSLLREEVKFGRKSSKRAKVPEQVSFFLLHLSLMREYLELEFTPLKDKLFEKGLFEFDIEKIIDDWILMGFLVGNDFIPNLPNLHITNGALPILYNAYMEILPTLDGYINEAGTLNLDRFEKFMGKLAEIDKQNFRDIQDDLLYFETKTGRKSNYHNKVSTKNGIDNDENREENEDKASNMDPALAALINQTNDLDVSSNEEDSEESSSDDQMFKLYKDEYYRNKLEYPQVTQKVMRDQAEGYVRAIQWNLNYYYNGVCSWSWFYPHHYAPYISDVKGFANTPIEFDLGKPFQPYEQLLAVLPAASKSLLPECYHQLMTGDSSIIKEYYPEDFQTDLNGKKQEWEGVVLVPFIDEKLLLEAMDPCNQQLTAEEVKRNTHGPMLEYRYTEDTLEAYEAPSYFPIVSENHAHLTPIYIQDIRVPPEKLIKGVYPGAKFDVYYPGFPTMKHLKYTSALQMAKVKVFEQNSRNENMILKIAPCETYSKEKLPTELLGKIIWVRWPHLVEAKVVGVSSATEKYVFDEKTQSTNRQDKCEQLFKSELEGISGHYFNRLGIDVGKTDVLVHVKTMTGRRYAFSSYGRVNLEKQFLSFVSQYPVQSIVVDIKTHDDHQSTFTDLSELFPVKSTCFSVAIPYYGSQGIILDSGDIINNGQLKVSLTVFEEPNLQSVRDFDRKQAENYYSLGEAASYISISRNVFSRITGSLFVDTVNDSGESKSTNIGLDLKFNKRNQETPGYTRKIDNYWCYSQKTINLVGTYFAKFPEVFTCLTMKENSNSNISASEIFGKEDGDDRVKEVQEWLKTLPTHNIDRRTCNSVVLEPETVRKIEELVDEHNLKTIPKNIVLNYKPSFLYKSTLMLGNLVPDRKAKHHIFDRVVYVREDQTVPLGLKGTIIAKYQSTSEKEPDEVFDIVFDKPFAGGMPLNCSDERGYKLSKVNFINISHGKREMEEKTGIPGELVARAKEQQNFASYQVNNTKGFPPGMVKDQHSAFAPFNKVLKSSLKSHPPPHVTMKTSRSAPPKNQFDYMSDFGKNFNVRANQVANSQTTLPSSSASAPTAIPAGNVKSEVIDTDFLKKVLKIDSSPTKSTTNHNLRPDLPVAPVQRNIPSACAKLLSYCQLKGLGCPKYAYMNRGGAFFAQIVLFNGVIVTGQEAQSREEASEHCAAQALNILEHLEKPSTRQAPQLGPPRFPVPPTKWIGNNQRPQQAPSTNVRENVPNSFVPLQVKKRQTHASSASSAPYGGSSSQPDFKSTNRHSTYEKQANPAKDRGQNVSEPRKNHTKNKPARKPRIAANFGPPQSG